MELYYTYYQPQSVVSLHALVPSGTSLLAALNIFFDDEPDWRHPGYDAHGLLRNRSVYTCYSYAHDPIRALQPL